MKFKRSKKLIWLFIAFQLAILTGMVISSMRPLLYGKEIVLQVQSRDPRDIFRGNYVALNYNFSIINLDTLEHQLPSDKIFTYGDKLYLELHPDSLSWKAVALWQEPQPESENVFLAVTVQHMFSYDMDTQANIIELDAGISSYFTNPEKALQIEEMMRQPLDEPIEAVYVKVMVGKNGQARIKELLIDK
jgi:uncharacterized membrane-anchored protein